MKLFKLLFLCLILTTSIQAQDKNILLVGDSWAQFQLVDGTHEDVFSANGFTNIKVIGLLTTELGTKASDWAQPEKLQLITGQLIANPTIDTIQITLGGNDFLANWRSGMSLSDVLALQQQIVSDFTTIIESILIVDPNIEIVLSFYDYPNFVDTIDEFFEDLCRDKWQDLGEPSAFEINNVSTSFELVYQQIANNNPRVFHVDHLGLMQSFYGFPNAGIAPGVLKQPGDLNRPSPVESMRDTLGISDCFHLSPQSHEYLVKNLFDGYFKKRFDTVFKSGFDF